MTRSTVRAEDETTGSTGTQTLPVTIEDVYAARERIAGYLPRTPLFSSTTLGRMSNTQLWLKAENLQRTGSFKIRGALNAILQLSEEQRARGIVTMSAGNHGQGVAYAATQAGVNCTVFMPETTTPVKVNAIRGYGAETRFAPTMREVFAAMEAYRQEHGLYFLHPFGDPAIVAGQGTVALEILEDLPELEAVVTGVGGGGLLGGTAVVVKALRPGAEVIGVEPVGAAAVSTGLARDEIVTLDEIETVADGLAAPFGSEVTHQLAKALVDRFVILEDREIVLAMRTIVERTKLLVEPAGASAVAALLTGKAQLKPGCRTVAVLTGGNIDLVRLAELLCDQESEKVKTS